MIAFLIPFVALLALSCRAEATAPPTVRTARDPQLQHHDVRADRLPPPFATKSAGNPPFVAGRPEGGALHLPPGFTIEVWASKLSDPRSLALAPNGDVFLSEPGAGRIDVFRGGKQFTFASGLDSPFGLAFHGNFLYVGNESAVVRFPYTSGQTVARGAPEKIAGLPGGGHSTRNVIFNRDGSKMYVSIGSSSNVSAEGPPRAAIMEYNPDGSGRRVFASGLRNPVGLAWNPATGALWTTVNERDGLGDDLVPDYITDVRNGAFYGWPYSYIGGNVDPRRKGEHPELVANAVVPSLLIESHSAPLGMLFYDGKMFPPEYRGDAFVALHGSWNREQRTGYKIIRVPFRNGHPAGGYDDFIAGWETDPGARRVWGRPVSLLVLPDGSMLVTDDGTGVVWRVAYRK
ncbi:MAG: cytochrome c, class [Acidobacteria bacterium]|nr:cytochrome c, class [Acidobacteriota bacterium]